MIILPIMLQLCSILEPKLQYFSVYLQYKIGGSAIHPPTLAEMEETRGEDGRTEEAQEDGATDELEAGILFLLAKLLSDAV